MLKADVVLAADRHCLWAGRTLQPCGPSTGRRSGWTAARSSRPCVLASRLCAVAGGTAVWVEGEPGIGKSSLVIEALAGASELADAPMAIPFHVPVRSPFMNGSVCAGESARLRAG